MKKILLILLLCFSSFHFNLSAQQLSTEGVDFWMGFMENGGTPQALNLFITSKYNTSGTVTIPLNSGCSGCTQNFTVTANQTTVITMPTSAAHTTHAGGVPGGTYRNTGIHITSNDSISVFAVNNLVNSTDATVILPKPALGTNQRYVISTFDANSGNSEFLVVGTEDDTEIRIELPTGQVLRRSLDAGETYLYQSNSDLTGTVINPTDPCKVIAVFAGVECVTIPSPACSRCDHIVAQQYPVNTWDREYLVTPFGTGVDAGGRSLVQTGGYMLKIMRDDNVTNASINGTPVSWNGGNFHEVEITGHVSRVVTSDNPVSVTQYTKGQECNGLPLIPGLTFAKGDPSQLVLNPSSQMVQSVTFNTVNTTNLTDHFVNIILKTESTGCAILDGSPVDASEFTAFPNKPDYSYAILQISEASHTLECQDGFIAYCYGVGERESYAYTVGARFEDLGYGFSIASEYAPASVSGETYACEGSATSFEGIGDGIIAYSWDFGDGNTATGSPIEHTFGSTGVFTVTLTATVDDGCGGGQRDIISTREVEVLSPPNVDLGSDQTICPDGSIPLDAGTQPNDPVYIWYKDGEQIVGANAQTFTATEAGNYYAVVSNLANCEFTSNTVNISLRPTPSIDLSSLADDYCSDFGVIDLYANVSPSSTSDGFFELIAPNGSITALTVAEAQNFDIATLSTDATYTIKYVYTDNNPANPSFECTGEATKDIFIRPLPALAYTDLQANYCQTFGNLNFYETVNLNDTNNGSFTLIDGSGNANSLSVAAAQAFDLSTLNIGETYTLRYNYTEADNTNPSFGCSNILEGSFTITAPPSPSFTPAFIDSYCANGASVNLYNQVNPADPANGSFFIDGNLVDNPSAFSPASQSADFILEYVYNDPSAGCSGSVFSSNISLITPPEAGFIQETINYCTTTESINLYNTVLPEFNNPTNGNFSINGNPVTSPTDFDPRNFGESYSIVFNYTDPITGCSNTASQSVGIVPPSGDFVGLQPLYCQSNGSVTLQVSPANGGEYRVNGVVTSELDPSSLPVGTHLVEYEDDCGVLVQEQIEVIAELPTLRAEDVVICTELNEVTTLDMLPTILAEGIETNDNFRFEWSTGETDRTSIEVSELGTYFGYFFNEDNCRQAVEFRVGAKGDCRPMIGIPTAFSPNGDGLNDRLVIQGQYFERFQITIFNRWGEIVFIGEKFNVFVGADGNEEMFWDGTLNGKDAPVGTYVCVVEYQLLPDQPKQKMTQSVTLLR